MANQVDAKLVVQILANTVGLKKSLDQSGKSLGAFRKQLTGVASTLGIAFGTREILQFAAESAKLAGQFQGVDAAFERLPQNTLLLHDLTEATHGTVSELTLMQRTMQAANLGIGIKELPTLFEFAAIRAQQTGESVDYLVDSIVRGIGRKSPLILDNLGISAARLKEQFGGAALEAQSIADVTAAVGRIAREELGKMGEFSENNASRFQQMSAEWQEFKIALGTTETGIFAELSKGALDFIRALTVLAEHGFSGFEEGLFEAGALNQAIKDSKLVTEQADKTFRDSAQDRIDFVKDEIKEREQLQEQYRREQSSINELIGLAQQFDAIQGTGLLGFASPGDAKRLNDLKEEFRQLHEVTFGYARELDGNAVQALKNNLEAHGQLNNTISQTIKLLEQYVDAQQDGNDANVKGIGLVAALEEQIKRLGEEIKNATSVSQIRELQHELEGAKIKLDALLKPSVAPAPVLIPIEFPEPDLALKEFADRILAIQDPVIIPVQVDFLSDEVGKADEQMKEWQTSWNETAQIAAQNAMTITNAMSGIAESVASGQENAIQALAGATLDIIQLFQQQALAAAIAAAFKSGGPLPIGLALAGIAIGAVRGLFRKTIGKVGGGGGGGGGGVSQATRARRDTASASATPIRVELGVTEFRVRGRDLVATLNNQQDFNIGLAGG